jgi:DNA-binding XRE family transcriptional regulator
LPGPLAASYFLARIFLNEIAKTCRIATIIDMPSGRSLYQRGPERYAREKEHFQRLIYKLKRLALKRGYTKNQIAAELGVSHTCIYQWWIGYSLSAKRKTIERLKNFLSAH